MRDDDHGRPASARRLAAYPAGAHGSSGETERPRFQKVGAGSARAEIQRRHLPNVPLVRDDGRSVRFYEDLVRDKKVVLTFASSRAPAFSDTVTSNLAMLQRLFGRWVGADMFLYSVARDLERDTQAMLKDWAVSSGAGPGWKFPTGRPADVEALRRGLGFASPGPGRTPTRPTRSASSGTAEAWLRERSRWRPSEGGVVSSSPHSGVIR